MRRYLSTVIFYHMQKEFYVIIFVLILVMALQMMLVSVHNQQTAIVLARTAIGARKLYARQLNIPESHVILYEHIGHQRQLASGFFLPARSSLGERPVVGDHIHMAISFWIHDNPRHIAEHDREPIQTIAYEPPFGKDKDICQTPGNISYHKVWSHAGVHTHCDGLIHVHPWSAPRSLRKEGLDVRLGLWFDQVGIEYREWPTVSITFPDGQRIDSNTTHRWHVAEKICFHDEIPAQIYTSQFDEIWLGHAYASYIVWFDTYNTPPPKDIPERIKHLKQVGVHGAFQKPYPHTCKIET